MHLCILMCMAWALHVCAQVRLESRHPYKPTAPADKKGRERLTRRVSEAVKREEKHEWPGASQLQLSFDRRCATEPGDWLTLTFFKEGRELAGRAVRMGGAWSHWPRTLTVPADTLHLSFHHAGDSFAEQESWGYGLRVVASKRWSAERLATPSLVQLQTSLVYLGAKCTSNLVTAEPVIDEERENRHWLGSPLLNRGLPLQLPADHPLMHPFYGITQSEGEGEAASARSREAHADEGFLDDLAGLSGGAASALHAYLLESTPDLKPRRASAAAAAAGPHGKRSTSFDAAERALLAALLSYNGLLGAARKAAALVAQRMRAPRTFRTRRVPLSSREADDDEEEEMGESEETDSSASEDEAEEVEQPAAVKRTTHDDDVDLD